MVRNGRRVTIFVTTFANILEQFCFHNIHLNMRGMGEANANWNITVMESNAQQVIF